MQKRKRNFFRQGMLFLVDRPGLIGVRRLISHTQCENKPWTTKIKAIIKTMMVGATSNQKMTREILESGLET